MTATRPSSTVRGALSPQLAALRLAELRTAALARLVAEEALWAIGGGRAVVWVYRHSLRRLLLEHDGLDVESVEPARDAALLDRPQIWRGAPTPARRRLREASFGGDDGAPVLSLPLRAGERPVGLLLIEDPALTREPDIAAAVEPFAGQAAALLHNHAQYALAHRNEANLQALYETAGELSSNLELETVLHAIAKRARVLLDAPIAHVMLADEQAGEIAMRVSDGTTRPGFATLRLKLGSGLGGRVAEWLTPYYTSDYLNDTRFQHNPAVDAEVRGEGIRSIIGVPMTEGDAAFIGVLFVADRVVRTFTDADVDVLSGLADHAAIALRNAELYDQATAAVAKLERINRVVHVQNRQLQRAEQLRSQLTQAMLAGQGLSDIVGLMAGFLEAHVMVLDHRYRVLAAAGPQDELAARIAAEGLERAMSRSAAVRRAVRTVEDREPAVLEAQSEGSDAHLIVPVAARDEVLGSIWVAVRPDALAGDRPLIEQATRVVALDLLKDRAIAEVERRVGRELLDALLAEEIDLGAGLERRAGELGIDLGVPHRILAVRLDRPGKRTRSTTREQVVRALRRQRCCAFVAEYGALVVGLVPGSEPDVAATLRPVIEELAHARAVLSPPCATLAEYRPQFIAARRALELAGGGEGAAVIDLDDAWLLTLLFRGGNEAELRRFVEVRLGPLLRHDAEHGLGLVATLEAYLEADRSPTRTAAALHVHVNTVYYRLERLKAVLGDRFGEPRHALDLQVALLAHRLLGARAR